ncbi:type II secretion system major pseudopilin GspG [soil metagenome]
MSRKDREAGYTLTEMLVVIGIIGLIAAVLTPTLMGQMTRARAKAAQLQLKNVSAAVELFKEDVGRYPTAAEGLTVLITAPPSAANWTGPYVEDANALNDPWGQQIQYTPAANGRRYVVKSLGADGEVGGKGADRDLTYPALAAP